jgi:serine phosphatase RsbU (regulator of sigma subunit)
MRILVRDGQDLIDTLTFKTRRLTIGSDTQCDVTINDQRLKPVQAAISPQPDGSWRLDNTANDPILTLNNRPVHESTIIQHADEIRLFDYLISVYNSSNQEMSDKPAATTMINRQASQLRAHPLPPGSTTKRENDDATLPAPFANTLARLHQHATECTDIAKLIEFTIETLLQQFDGRVAFVGTRKRNYGPLEFEQGRHRDGHSVGRPHDFDHILYRCLESEQRICIPRSKGDDIESAIAAPITSDGSDLGILYVDRKKSSHPLSESDLDRLTFFASTIAAQLDRIEQNQNQTRIAVNVGQVAFVREIQARLDPSNVPQWKNLQLAAYCKPGSTRGSDIFDIMQLPNGLAAILVATLDGQPTRVAMAMAEVRAAFRIAGLHADPPHMFLRAINWMLTQDREPCTMNAVAIVMNPNTGTMELSSAGTIDALLIDAQSDARQLAAHNIPPVGSAPTFAYEPIKERISPGETLALLTAGCFSVTDTQDRTLERQSVFESIRDGFGQSAAIALDELIADHASFFKNGQQPDDITILMFHRGHRQDGQTP